MVGIFLASSKYGKVQLGTKQNSPLTVTGGNEAGVDVVLIKLSLLCHVNHLVLMLTSIY